MCCCCICHCSRPETVNLSCFGCFPIKCGIVSIGILTLFLILSSLVEIFAMLLNEGIHWWYVLVALLLLIPTILAASFLTAFFNTDNGARRAKLRAACILVIISFSLLAIWNIVYFQCWYKGENVSMGQADFKYKQTKKQYVFWSVSLHWLLMDSTLTSSVLLFTTETPSERKKKRRKLLKRPKRENEPPTGE